MVETVLSHLKLYSVHEATDVRCWSFVSSNEPVKNGGEVIYEMFHILNCGFEIKEAMIIAVMNAI